jgi:(2Fe-2S) ferredoxin
MTSHYFQNHIFCCTNQRPDDHARGSCAAKGGERLRNYMKDKAKELGIAQTRINGAGCLDRCEHGAVLVIYPQGIWYRAETKSDIDAILAALQAGTIATHLQLPARG